MAVPTPLSLPRTCSPSARDQPPPPGILDTNDSNGHDSWDSGSRRMSDGWQMGPVDDLQQTMDDSLHQQQQQQQQQTRRHYDSVAAGRPDRMTAIAEEQQQQQQQQQRSTKDSEEEEGRGRSGRGSVPRRQRAVSADDKANGVAAAGGGARDIENRKKNTTGETWNRTEDRPLSPGTTNRPSNGASLHDPVKREALNGDRKSGQTLSSSLPSVMGLGLESTGEKQIIGSGTTSATTGTAASLLEEPGEEGVAGTDGTEGGARNQERDPERILKLSPSKMQELTSSPESIPYRAVPESPEHSRRVVSDNMHTTASRSGSSDGSVSVSQLPADMRISSDLVSKIRSGKETHTPLDDSFPSSSSTSLRNRPHASRTVSTPSSISRRQQQQPSSNSERLAQTWALRTKQDRVSVARPEGSEAKAHLSPSPQITESAMPSPMPQSIPLPPVSIPTYLQLELASGRPSPLYIHHSATTDFPYESARVKLERLVNFLMLPPAVEQVLWFGLFACLDAWLYSFTILPLRFVKAVYILLESWAMNLSVEFRYVSGFVYNGIGRVWRRRNKAASAAGSAAAASIAQERGAESDASRPRTSTLSQDTNATDREMRTKSGTDPRRRHTYRHHRRQKSIPSALLPDDKADILKGLLMISTCWVLMYFDASRMYHWIRGQAAIKLYVIYNVLEVSDRLFAAIGQDVLECLFSREALERRPDGRSKVFRPFGLFLLALAYTVIHATSLFYQVMTLNVAVNSYSNALITLLLSNQFVEIKSTVFKKFEKENLFQLTCADVVERFQLWLMLTIIASRNIVETGAFNFVGSIGSSWSTGGGNSSTSTNSTPLSTPPRTASSILPQSFTIFPSSLISSFSKVNSFLPSLAQVLGPFLVVLGSEMLVDWLKHAYINKFNNTRPTIYGRFLDVLAKDYYTNAFGDQNLTRRLGLPVIPLSCLFFRVSVQTYKMFLAASLPQQPSSSTVVEATQALTSIHRDYAPAPAPSMPPLTLRTLVPSSIAYFSAFFRSALANAMPSPAQSVYIFTAIFIIALFIVLLIFKLVLGMGLLALARSRYKAMKGIEQQQQHHTHHNHHHHHHHHAHNHSHNLNTSNALANGGTGTGTGSQQREHSNSSYTVEGSRRVGGWGVVEVNEDKRRWIYADDPEALKRLKAKEEKDKKSAKEGESLNMDHVQRYEMVAKRIW